MGLKKIINEKGKTTGVFIPIEEWVVMKEHYPNLENLAGELPQWQRELLDQRLLEVDNHPEELLPIEQLFKFLEK